MISKGFKKISGLLFEIIALSYLVIISITKLSLQINLGKGYLIPIIISANILIFIIEKSYFKNYILLLRGHISMNLLIAIACHSTYLYSIIMLVIKTTKMGLEGIDNEFWETPIALFALFRIGKIIEGKLKNTSMKSKYEIMQLKNQKSLIIVDNKHKLININKIQVGDLLYIPKGATVTVDAELISESASLDISTLTGEGEAAIYRGGEEISSGSINVGEALICKAIRDSENSKIGKILQHLEEMMDKPTRIELISQKIVRFFIPVILSIVAATFVIWMILGYVIGGENLYWIYRGDRAASPLGIAIWVSTAVLVIACPCAFGIAAPIAIYSSSIIATDNRILFSKGEILERMLKVKYAVFDKTGTITENASRVVDYYGDRNELDVAIKLSSSSNHPVGRAITELLHKNGSKDWEIIPTNEIVGVGIEAFIDGTHYQLVSKKYSDSLGYTSKIELPNNKNNSYTMLIKNNEIIGGFSIEDVVRENSKATIKALKNIGIEPIILSGDSCNNVQKTAKKIGITDFKCQLSPEMKMEEVKKLQLDGDVVYIGDGINDVLATKASKLSISFGSGADLNKSLADITITDNDIFSVYRAIILSKRTVRTVKANFIWAVLFNIAVLPLACLGFIIPWLGMVLMMSSSVILLLHTLIRHKIDGRAIGKKPSF